MESPLVFALILFTTTFAAATSIQKIHASENPLPVGSNVTLFSQDNVTVGAWLFDNDIIVLIFPGNTIITNNWINRVAFNPTFSSLTINSVQLEDSGLYTLQAVNSFRAQLTLSVQVPISGVTLRANATNLVEFNDTAVLTCSVLNGSSLSYVWLKGSSVVTAGGGVQLSDGGATLTMVRVTRYYEGSFRCNVSNGLSHESSLPVYLNISYGPSNTMMVIMPMRSTYITGSNITLSCSADSSPPAMIQWMVDGVYLNNFGPHLQLETVTESNSGNYQCVFHNTVTLRFSSKSAMIRIMDPPKYVHVEAPMNPAIEGYSYKLTCNATGTVKHVYWMKNGELLREDNTTVFSSDNKTVTFNPLKHNDTGHYQCVAINALWNMTSPPYMLLVNFGPKKPMIHGPAFAETGQYAVFRCSAMSMPPSQFSWWFNGSNVANSSVFTTDVLSLNMSGEITCKAYNNVTGKNVTKSKMLTVIEAIGSVMITNNTVPINTENFTLTCDVIGPYDMIYWMKDNVHLNMTHSVADPHMSYHIENNSLHFTPVTLHNEGTYQCVATNQAGPHKSPKYMLLVNYGPLSVNISLPYLTKHDLYVSLTCSADSRPDCDFHWFLNYESSAAVHMGSVITFLATNQGNYTCKATNPVTNITMYTTKAFTVTAHASALRFPSQGGLLVMGLFALSVPVLFS
ncbi:cell adhesion molecule CEACAM5-like [Anarhichas minor]|uniref:cell adhesion molecule CEACAM5-like n=1 Tax=Anarhichas minor TaxID=65739 RepID=UPI003F733492